LNGGMMRGLSISPELSGLHVQTACARWIAGTVTLTALVWLAVLAGLLALAGACGIRVIRRAHA